MAAKFKTIAVSEFKQKWESLLSESKACGESIVVTRHGKGIFVVLAPEAFNETIELMQFGREQLAVQNYADNQVLS